MNTIMRVWGATLIGLSWFAVFGVAYTNTMHTAWSVEAQWYTLLILAFGFATGVAMFTAPGRR